MTTQAKPMPRWSTRPSGVTIVDLWARDGRQQGHRWWFRVRVKGMAASRAFPNDGWTVGQKWSTDKLASFLLTNPEDLAAKMAAAKKKKLQVERARLSWLIEDYLVSRKGSRRITSDEHETEMRRMVTAATAKGIDDITEPGFAEQLTGWLNSLKDQRDDSQLSDHTYNRFLNVFVALVRHAIRLGLTVENPLATVDRRVLPATIMPTFDLREASLLVSDGARTDKEGKEDPAWLLFAVALYTGLRIREAQWLTWEDIRLTDRVLHVRPPSAEERAAGARVKRNKARDVDLQPELAAILETEARNRFGDLVERAQGHLYDDQVRAWTSVQHRRRLLALCKRLTITAGERHVHSLRATFACLSLASGSDPISLRDNLGHSTLTMTGHYARAIKPMREVAKHWPRGEFYLRRTLPGTAATGTVR